LVRNNNDRAVAVVTTLVRPCIGAERTALLFICDKIPKGFGRICAWLAIAFSDVTL